MIRFLAGLLIIAGLSVGTISAAAGEPLVAVSQAEQPALKSVRTIAIFLNGNDALVSRLAEDALTIALTNAGLTVISRETLEKTVGEQLAKRRASSSEGALNALEIGRAVAADAVLTGTVAVSSGEEGGWSVKAASLQLIKVDTGKPALSVLFEPTGGTSFSELGRLFVGVLGQHRT